MTYSTSQFSSGEYFHGGARASFPSSDHDYNEDLLGGCLAASDNEDFLFEGISDSVLRGDGIESTTSVAASGAISPTLATVIAEPNSILVSSGATVRPRP
jgi:hypothetical protein